MYSGIGRRGGFGGRPIGLGVTNSRLDYWRYNTYPNNATGCNFNGEPLQNRSAPVRFNVAASSYYR